MALTEQEKAEIREEVMREEAFDHMRDMAEEAWIEDQMEMARMDMILETICEDFDEGDDCY